MNIIWTIEVNNVMMLTCNYHARIQQVHVNYCLCMIDKWIVRIFLWVDLEAKPSFGNAVHSHVSIHSECNKDGKWKEVSKWLENADVFLTNYYSQLALDREHTSISPISNIFSFWPLTHFSKFLILGICCVFDIHIVWPYKVSSVLWVVKCTIESHMFKHERT